MFITFVRIWEKKDVWCILLFAFISLYMFILYAVAEDRKKP